MDNAEQPYDEHLFSDIDAYLPNILEEDIISLEQVDSKESISKREGDRSKKRTRIDYPAIKARFIIGNRSLNQTTGLYQTTQLTLAQVAKEFGANLNSIAMRSSKEQWSVLRKAYQSRIGEQQEAKALNLYTYEGAQADTSAMIATNRLNKVFQTFMIAKYGDIVEEYDKGFTPDKDSILETVNSKELREIVAIAKEIHSLSKQVTASLPTAKDSDSLMADLKSLQKNKNVVTSREQQLKKIEELQKILTAQPATLPLTLPPTKDEP